MPSKRYTSKGKGNKNVMYAIIGILLIAGIGIGIFFAVAPQSPFLAQGEAQAPSDTTTITLLSYPDMEDVSNFVEITFWVPKDNAEFDETEDIYTLSNFEEEETSKDADSVSVDMDDYSYAWIEIDPDGESVFSNDFHLIYGGANYDYTFYVNQLTSDVNFNLFARDTLNEITVASYATDSNVTLIFDCPHYTTTNIHANSDDWDVDDEDWDDMTDSEKLEYYDEANWRNQNPLYDPTVDLEKDFEDPLEMITNALAFKLDFNDSVSTVDGNGNQINITLADDDAPVEVVISGDLIYLIYYNSVSFTDGAQELGFEIEFGADIELSDIDSGRIVLPRGDDALGTFTKYSDIGA